MKHRRVAVFLMGMVAAGIFGCGRSVSYYRKPAPLPAPSAASPSYPKPYKVMGQWYQPLPDAKGFRQTGVASWYGEDFHGKKTSNGEIYDMYGESAAHKTLPLGTIVRVRNLDNNREMEIRINDRGPFVAGRVIDLSYGCAVKLGVVGPGTAPVEVVAVGTTTPVPGKGGVPSDYFYQGNFTIQVGAFSDPKNAERLKAKLDRSYANAHIQPYDTGRETLYRVRVTKSTTLDQASQYEKVLATAGYDGAFTVAE